MILFIHEALVKANTGLVGGASEGRVMHHDLLGLGGNRVQLLQWMISLTTGRSWETGAGTIPRPGIMGFMGVIPAIMPRLGSKSEGEEVTFTEKQYTVLL